uniref:Titin n=1 Tax=Stegastes partitus TaxID=144197 RepID=A0A3B5ATD5_9TELE
MFFRVAARNEKGQGDFVEVGPIKVIDYIITPEADLSEYPDGRLSIRLGHNVHIELPYKGKPRPAVLWLKDNLPLKESDQVRFKKTENKATLMIKNVKKENDGKYTLTLDNKVNRRSFHIHVITLGPPSKPVGPIRLDEVRAESIMISWDEPNDDGGGDITCYTVEKRDTSQPDWKMACSSVVGAEYKFRVAAVNHVGRGEDKEIPEPAQAVDRLTPPQVDIDATFKQTHIVKAGGSVCLGIHFRGKPIPTATWVKEEGELGAMSEVTTTDGYSSLTIENCSRTDTGKYTVNLENASGSKAITFVVKVMDTPGPPQTVAFKEVSRGSVTLIWEPPLNDGGARIHHFIVERREASRRTWQQSGGKCTQHILKIQDLLEGVPYFFRVSAENQHGIGEAFEVTEPVIATAEPSAPKRMDILDTTDSTVVLGWLKPEHDGGSRIQHYVIEAKAKGTDKWMVVGNTKNLTYVVEKLNKGDEYDFRVKAKNESGYSTPKETLAPVLVKEPHIEPAADLSEIANQLVTCRSNSTFTIDVPISGRPAPKVTWKLEEMRLKSSDRVSIKVTKDRTSISVKEAMRGDGGKYYLTLENVAGTRTFTIDVNVTGRPSPPTGPIEISSITSESCVVNWQPPEDDGGTVITNYIVEKRESGSTAWQLINSSVKRTSLHVSHLTKYMQYTFRVSAENRFGVSKPTESETIVAEHPFSKPEVTNVTRTTVSLKWSSPLNDGGSPIVGYIIERKPYTLTGEGRWLKCNYTNVTDNFYTVTALGEGEPYESSAYLPNPPDLFSARLTLVRLVTLTSYRQCSTLPHSDLAHLNLLYPKTCTMNLVLDAAVGGRPDPKTSWSKGNRELDLCEKYHLQYTPTRAMAIIKFCDRDDTGKYILTVRNVSGTKTQLSMITSVFFPDTPGVCEGSIEISKITEESCTLSWKPPLEDGGDDIAYYIVERRDTNRLNWVIMHAECKEVTCNITGLFKNTEYLFRVRGVNKYGAGVYLQSELMVARNTFIFKSPTLQAHILIFPSSHTETPDFELHDDLKKTICLRAGGSLRLFVNVTGRPAPAITWSKPGVDLQNRGFIEVTNTSTTLIIDKVHRYDAGKYTLVAENSAGKQEVNILVKVYGKLMTLSETKGDFQK